MALEDLQSQYGPSNKKGKIGTGTDVDTLAYETGGGLADRVTNPSNYQTPEKTGAKPEYIRYGAGHIKSARD